MSMVGKRKQRKSSDKSQPSISPDSKLTKMKGEEFNMATTSSEEEVPIWSFNSNQGAYESFKFRI